MLVTLRILTDKLDIEVKIHFFIDLVDSLVALIESESAKSLK